MPAGCVLVRNVDGSADALFNTGGTGGCKTSTVKVAGSQSAKTGVKLGLQVSDLWKGPMTRSKGVFCSGNKDGVLKSFHAKTASVTDMTAALESCETFCMSDAACQACSVDQYYVQNYFQWSAIPTSPRVGFCLCGPVRSPVTYR